MYYTGKQKTNISPVTESPGGLYECTVRSLSQAGLNSSGAELSDSTVLQACGLISKTKPTVRVGVGGPHLPAPLECSPSRAAGER